MGARLAWLLDLRATVSRGAYAAVGFGLMGLKYGVDALAIHALTGRTWTPLDYLIPLGRTRLEWADLHPAVGLALAAWTLPFAWIGVSLTLRRAVDAGFSPWLALLFFVPLLNYALMLGLCFAPSRPAVPAAAPEPSHWAEEPSGLAPVLAGLAAGVPTFLVSAYLVRDYGLSLFAGTPFLMGCVCGFLHRARGGSTLRSVLVLPAVTVAAACGLLLLFALEGAVCVMMILPLGLPLAVLGGLTGWAVGGFSSAGAMPALIALAGLPGVASVESALARPAELEVVTSVDVDAPPERVWPHVVAFAELPPPTELLFRVGIACPVRARIEGRGVGAVRTCEFTTGAFVEPITAWDEPRRLAFDVARQPEPLRELHPWAHVRPPHLEDGWRSLRGEFRLERLPGGRTRLHGTTWCELRYAPVPYWRPWAEGIVHAIHARVLRHVKALAES